MKNAMKYVLAGSLAMVVMVALVYVTGCGKKDSSANKQGGVSKTEGVATTGQDVFEKIGTLGQQGSKAEAVAMLDKLIKDTPQAQKAVDNFSYKAAGAYNELQEYGKALEICNGMLKNNPNDPWSLRIMGESYRLQGKYEEAKGYFKKSISADAAGNSPGTASAYCAMAMIDKAQKNITGAKKYLEEAIKIMPTDQFYKNQLKDIEKE